jgi:hypothetical protein
VWRPPWQRDVERTFQPQADVRDHRKLHKGSNGLDPSNGWSELPRGTIDLQRVEWVPTCGHDGEPVPCQILDPFAGVCSTLLAAARLGRDSTGIEVGRRYAEMGRDRVLAEAPMLVEVAIE